MTKTVCPGCEQDLDHSKSHLEVGRQAFGREASTDGVQHLHNWDCVAVWADRMASATGETEVSQ